MKKILILTAGFGEGHNAAARNLQTAIEKISDYAQVEVLDLFESTYTTLMPLVRKAHLGVVRYAPKIWSGIYSLLDNSTFLENRLGGFTKLRNALGHILHEVQPDVVVSTYPAYSHVIKQIYQDHVERPFRFFTIITDSISVNSTWYKAESDYLVVANEATVQVLRDVGVAKEKIKPIGFPVDPIFAEERDEPLAPPTTEGPWKILYLINTGKKKAGKALEKLLQHDQVHLTITAGKDADLKASLSERFADYGERVNVLGWTNLMPQLMMSHHLAIGKAGGATVQESIAAKLPLLVNQILPGQEEGNARLIEQHELGDVLNRNREVPDAVASVFADDAKQWHEWRRNLDEIARPNAASELARLVIEECDWHGPEPTRAKNSETTQKPKNPRSQTAAKKERTLLCDFHMHSNYSDGKLSVPDLVDFYGKRGFDAICITDHLADPCRVCGKITNLTSLVLGANQLDEYFEVIDRERQRAWRKYNMILMTGIEFNKDGLSKKSSAHLLGIDLQAPISPSLDLPETIAQIHAQGGLSVASHPHFFKTEWGKNTLYLWENIETFAPLIDAWEIANRNEIFTPIGAKRLPYLANSDFHKPKHIYSWKSLLHCEKEPEAIKECIRRNEHVSITLYREGAFRQPDAFQERREAEDNLIYLRNRLPLAAAR